MNAGRRVDAMKPVRDVGVWPGMRISDLVAQLEDSGGFAARYLGMAARILKSMLRDEECVRFLSFVGAPVATGLRGVIAEAVKRGLFNAIITTCGALDHDIARSLSEYYNGDFWLDDAELRERGYHRLGSVLIRLDSYGPAIRDFRLNLFRDAEELAEIVFKAKRTGALMIGGGISKHHTLWWNQFRDGLDYAIYVTTACEYDGSLSGARVSEAVSWMKVKPEARRATVYGDATIIIPILIACALDGG